MLFKAWLLLFLCLTCGACQGHLLYDWGSYESSIHSFYNSEGEFPIGSEIDRLTQELERTPAERIPPGKAAYLGYLHTLIGEHSIAEQYFKTEIRLYPESRVFINRLIATNQATRKP